AFRSSKGRAPVAVLQGRPLIFRTITLVAAAPSILLARPYGDRLLQDLPEPPLPMPPSAVLRGEANDWLLQVAVQLTRNSRVLPPAMWLSASASAALALQVFQNVGSALALRATRSLPKRTLILVLAVWAASLQGAKLPGLVALLARAEKALE
ncbi:unnamed protein product, partial [Polarella glacialis]